MRRPALRIVLPGLLAAGCSAGSNDTGAATPEVVPLLDPWMLQQVAGGDDPLASHRPAAVDCPAAAFGPEDGSFEVETGVCNYAAFRHALPTPIRAGDRLDLVVWHDLLDAVEPGIGHVAVLLGDEVVWEAEVDIPADSTSLEASVSIEHAPPADAMLGLHLHNHGYNSWRFVGIDRVRD